MIVLDGVRDLLLPCSLALVVPLLVVTVAGRGRWAVALGGLGTSALTVWAGAAFGVGLGASVPRRVLAGMVLGAGVLLVRRAEAPVRRALGGAAVGAPATMLWVPCVGERLGAALSAAPTEPFGQLLPLVGWAGGVGVPVLVTAACVTLVARRRPVPTLVAEGAAVLGLVLASVVTLGGWRHVVGALVRAST